MEDITLWIDFELSKNEKIQLKKQRKERFRIELNRLKIKSVSTLQIHSIKIQSEKWIYSN